MAEQSQSLTPDAFRAMARDLRDYARAHPLNILARIRSGEGPPLEHRRDFRYREWPIRVLFTEDEIGRPGASRRAEHLSVMSLAGRPLPDFLLREVLSEFWPGQGQPGGPELIVMPSVLPGCKQYIVLTREQ